MHNFRVELTNALKFVDGAPDVFELPCDILESPETGEYMKRYYLESSADGSIRFHNIINSDPGNDLHDHPWDFVTVLVSGSYKEVTPTGITRYEAPCLIMRKANDFHRLILDEGEVWTYFVCGKVKRKWGFKTERGWIPYDRYSGLSSVIQCEPTGIKTTPILRKQPKRLAKW
jgi:hypothetical protein